MQWNYHRRVQYYSAVTFEFKLKSSAKAHHVCSLVGCTRLEWKKASSIPSSVPLHLGRIPPEIKTNKERDKKNKKLLLEKKKASIQLSFICCTSNGPNIAVQ